MSRFKINNKQLQPYTVILSTRDYRHIGQLTGARNMHCAMNDNSAHEFSFNIDKIDFMKISDTSLIDKKTIFKIKNNIWKQVQDFKLIYVKELDEYFEIYVHTIDSLGLSKRITATSLCEAELSNSKVTMEINTEKDIARNDYEPTVFYNPNNINASLLHRALSKMPHYTIDYVDESLWNIQRTFSVSEQWIYDFFTSECSEQFNCIFKFNSTKRTISVYDLYSVCSCKERGDFKKCPKCGNTNLKTYGNDTSIYVDSKNLTDNIELNMNPDNVKNCFKLEAGDELMTSTVKLVNLGNSEYLIHVPEYQRKDMPQELVDKLKQYDEKCLSYQEEHTELVQKMYDLTDDILYLESGKMPSLPESDINASTEALKLTLDKLSPVALTNVSSKTEITTVNSALKNYAKVHVKTGYVKVDIDTDTGASFTFDGVDENNNNYGTWTGRFKVTNYSDSENVAYTDVMSIRVYDNYKEFVKQKILKYMSKDENKEGSVFDVLALEDIDEFIVALKEYSKKRLESFHSAIQEAIDILIQMDEGTIGSALYDDVYLGYYNKLSECEKELNNRQQEIDIKQEELDLVTKRLDEISQNLDFETNLEEYYKVFCAYRREDTYSNANFISDGLDNVEIIKKAKEFIDLAKQELIKSSEQQISISSTLYNFLALDEFKTLVDNFDLGNRIHIKIDGIVYTLRLISYAINFDNLDSIEVVFSNVSKLHDQFSDEEELRKSAHSISNTYSYVSKQADKGHMAQNSIIDWMNNSLNTSNIQITNSENNDITFGKHGILCRSKDDITGKYDDKQLILTFNALAFTTNNWKSVEQVIGEHNYIAYDPLTNSWVTKSDYGMTAKFVQAGNINGVNIVGGVIYSERFSDGTNGRDKEGTRINLNDGTFSFAGGNLIYNGEKLIIGDADITQSLINTGIVTDDLYVDATKITGQLSSGQIKNIDASQVSSGVLSTDRIPNLSASQITSDTFSSARIPNLNANKINDGVFDVERIPDLNGSKILKNSLPSDSIVESITDKTLDNCTFNSGSISIGTMNVDNDGYLTLDDEEVDNLYVRNLYVKDGINNVQGLSTTITVGEMVMNFINGVLVEVNN